LPPGLPKGSPVEVEYAYHANGRIAVSARVPTVRYSQHVEIKRDSARSLDDLGTWRARLCGQAKPSADPADRAATLKQLDALYLNVGKVAVKLALPPSFARSRQAAIVAADELTAAQSNLKQAERARQTGGSTAEAIRLDARLAQAKAELQEVQVRSDFAHLVLGRECVTAGIEPPEARQYIAEIRRLQHP
jgi:hypothetical protein